MLPACGANRMTILKSSCKSGFMKDAGKIVAETLVMIQEAVKPGEITLELNKIAEKYIRSCGAVLYFSDVYGRFEKIGRKTAALEAVCLKSLKYGNIVSSDNSAVKDVCCVLVRALLKLKAPADRFIGRHLLKATEFLKTGNKLGGVSLEVQLYGQKYGCGVVRDYVGHDISKQVSEDPQIPNYGSAGRGPRLKSGMTLAIEPMIDLGTHEVMKIKITGQLLRKIKSLRRISSIPMPS